VILALVLQLAAAAPRPMSRADSIAAAKFVQRGRREEQRFFAVWRYQWQNLRDLKPTDPRFWSLHCHGDDATPEDVYNVISMASSRKSMCPIWFQEFGTRGDENAWIDNAIPVKSREKIAAARGRVISLLDSAARLLPNNQWVLGQRVRLNIDQREFTRATLIVADECHTSATFCAMLDGYVQSKSGNSVGARLAFAQAASRMTPEDRCYFLNAQIFLDGADRDRYNRLSCAERDSIDARFWWLADPLWSDRGNERLAVHLERHTLLLLKSALTADEHFDYRVKYGGAAVAEMLLRYGWPSAQFHHLEQSDNHNGWLGFRDSASNASREYFRPRYHSTPDFSSAADIRTVGDTPIDMSAPWVPRWQAFDQYWWPIEHFPRAGSLSTADYQATALRRKHGPLVVVATDPVSPRLGPAALESFTIELVAMRSPADSARQSSAPARRENTGAVLSTLATTPGLQVISAEVVDQERDSATATRARFALEVPPGIDSLGPNEIAVSDLMLFAPSVSLDSLPTDTHSATLRMYPTTTLRDKRVGVFFELYGTTASDSVDLSLTVVRNGGPGILRRFGARLGLAGRGADSLTLRWETGRGATGSSAQVIDGARVSMRAIVLNLSTLDEGSYTLAITARRAGSAAVGRREFVYRP
jgi:hypothetical protein